MARRESATQWHNGRPLAGRVALVTGASSGIGRACAIALANAGAKVVVNYYSDSAAAGEVLEEIGANGGRALACRADVGSESDVEAMFARIRASFSTLHILVNNAGIQRDAALLRMTLEEWDHVLATNLRGQFLCARAAAREFCARAGRSGESAAEDAETAGAIGNMIFMSSVHDLIPWAGHANYAAAKGGVSMLMRTLAQELGPHKIRVNAVAPGAIATDINRAQWSDPHERSALLTKIPYGRIGEPDDVARAVLWLASDESDYVHGHTLYIDGGMTLYPSFRDGG